jgi:hypothetical protein
LRRDAMSDHDPLVKSHAAIENNNGHMDALASLLKDTAKRTNSAILVAHHFRKGAGDETKDAFRGASSLIDAARINRTMLPLNGKRCSGALVQ